MLCTSWYDCKADDCQRGAAHPDDEEGLWFEPEKGTNCYGYIPPETQERKVNDFAQELEDAEKKHNSPYKHSPRNLIIFDTLREYAEINQIRVRDTSDLSPLEEWLLIKCASLQLELQTLIEE